MLHSLFAITLLGVSSSLVIDRPDSIVKGWTELKKTDSSQPIKLSFALKNQNVDMLEKTLLDVSTPGNPEYGNHRSVESLQAMIAPSAESIDIIKNWLSTNQFAEHQIIRETPNDDLLSVVTTIGEAEKLLNCVYFDYLSDVDGKTVVSRIKLGTDYNLAANIGEHLYFVTPTHRFPYLQARVTRSVGVGEVNPTKLRELYNVGSTKGSARNNSQAIASFRTQYYNISDCKALWTKYDITPCSVTNVPTNEPDGNHLEAELDTQYISSMGEAIAMQVWWTKGINFENDLVEWTQNVLASKNRPDLFSVSYGGPESDFGASYIAKLNNQLALMGTAGVTVLFASGDSGAGGGCSGDDPFMPDYPASSPFVTAVGGVTGGTAGKTPIGESAWKDGGGGFSMYSPQQPWQKDAISYYLSNENNLPSEARYNATGRGYPDIAAQSVDFEIIANGKSEAVSGTSAASPTAAGIMALLNDLRAQNGMSKLGFLNPFIYKTAASEPSAFNDCTEGYNVGCGNAKGFEAYSGWDPSSGFGSPNYKVLAQKVLETGRQTIYHQQKKQGLKRLKLNHHLRVKKKSKNLL